VTPDPTAPKGTRMGRLENKIAIVTGAGRGIGKGIATKLAAEGAHVVVSDIDADTAQATAAELGGTAAVADVTSLESVRAMTEQVVAAHGRVDILVNNAGWDLAGPFLESDPGVWDKIMRINLYGVLNTTYTVVPHMVEAGTGAVVNVSSDAGRVGSSGEAVYSAAKGGIIAFTKTMARETARNGVRVNAVCPGPTDTALFASIGGDNPKLREALTRAIPMRRLGRPEDLAHAVAFLASDEAEFITGQTLSVSGGLTMV
jgi:2-hydroxycyclohexanecarboxyl-CoA dehydrogenase